MYKVSSSFFFLFFVKKMLDSLSALALSESCMRSEAQLKEKERSKEKEREKTLTNSKC